MVVEIHPRNRGALLFRVPNGEVRELSWDDPVHRIAADGTLLERKRIRQHPEGITALSRTEEERYRAEQRPEMEETILFDGESNVFATRLEQGRFDTDNVTTENKTALRRKHTDEHYHRDVVVRVAASS